MIGAPGVNIEANKYTVMIAGMAIAAVVGVPLFFYFQAKGAVSDAAEAVTNTAGKVAGAVGSAASPIRIARGDTGASATVAGDAGKESRVALRTDASEIEGTVSSGFTDACGNAIGA